MTASESLSALATALDAANAQARSLAGTLAKSPAAIAAPMTFVDQVTAQVNQVTQSMAQLQAAVIASQAAQTPPTSGTVP